MDGIYFEIDHLALWLTLALLILGILGWKWRRHFKDPQLFFSDLDSLKEFSHSKKLSLIRYPEFFRSCALGLFLLAFLDPRFYLAREGKEEISTEGIAIYIVADQSGSMKEIVETKIEGKLRKISRIELLKEITTQFVMGNPQLDFAGRPNDLIGLIEFARAARVVAPLTLDHQDVVKKISELSVVKDKEQDGTATGYALYKAANVIAATRYYNQELGSELPPYTIKSAVAILITDGFPDPNPLDIENPLRSMDPLQAAEYAKEKNVRIYVVIVNPDLAKEEFAPHRRLMEKIARVTGGKFYMMSSSNSLDQIYADIDRLEKTEIPLMDNLKDRQPHRYRRFSLYPFLIALGMAALLLSIVLETTFLRRIP